MVDRIIALIAISGIVSLVSAIHGEAHANLILKNEINNNQIERFYPIAKLLNNQSTSKEIVTVLKSQGYSDPFKIRGIGNERNVTSPSATENSHANEANTNDVKDTNINNCKSDCPDKSKATKYDVPFDLSTIPFP
jgi:hypothetical protein